MKKTKKKKKREENVDLSDRVHALDLQESDQ